MSVANILNFERDFIDSRSWSCIDFELCIIAESIVAISSDHILFSNEADFVIKDLDISLCWIFVKFASSIEIKFYIYKIQFAKESKFKSN